MQHNIKSGHNYVVATEVTASEVFVLVLNNVDLFDCLIVSELIFKFRSFDLENMAFNINKLKMLQTEFRQFMYF